MKSARRQALEAEGVRFITLREWLIKRLIEMALTVEPSIALALIRYIADDEKENK